MKHMLFLSAIALVAFVASCKKDDTTQEPTPQERLIGKWKGTKAFIGALDLLVPTSAAINELEIEFTATNTVAFHRKSTILTTNPPSVTESTLNGVYSWNNDIITITVTSGADSRTVVGPMDVTATHFLFTATSGDTTEFYSLLEADKL